jgi:hypothetical protein
MRPRLERVYALPKWGRVYRDRFCPHNRCLLPETGIIKWDKRVLKGCRGGNYYQL